MLPAAIALALLTLQAPTCGALDDDSALALASRNADEIAIKRAELAAAQADLAIARAARYVPEAKATISSFVVPAAHGTVANPSPETTDRSLSGLSPFIRIDLEVVQPIYTWGRLDAARDAATAGVKARESLVRDKLAELRVRIVQLFWGETLARKLLSVAIDVEKNLKDVDKKIDQLIKEGDESVKPADRYRLSVYKGVLRKQKADAQKGIDLAHGGLAATVGLAPAELSLREVELPLEPGDDPDAPRVRREAEQRRPDVAALDMAIAARDAEIRAAQGAMLPQFFVAGTFSYAYAGNRDRQFNPWVSDPFNHLGGGAVVGLQQDLSFPMLYAKLDKARAERETLKRQRDGISRLVAQQVDAAVSEVAAARERLAAANQAFGSGKQWFRSAGLDFQAGLGEPKDVLEAYASYIQLQVDQQQAAYDLVVARAKLDQASGIAPRVGPNPCGPKSP